MNSERNRDSPIEGLETLPTEEAILRELKADAFQHPGTILPLAVAVVSGVYVVILSPFLGAGAAAIALATLSGVAGAGNFAFRFLHVSDKAETRIKRVLDERAEMLLKAEEAELEQRREELMRGFAALKHWEGRKALEELVHQFQGSWDVLKTYEGPDILSIARLKVTVKETYKQGLAVLSHALNLLRANAKDSVRDLERDITTLEREVQQTRGEVADIKKKALERTRVRLERLKNHEVQIASLLDQSDQLEVALEQARLELARATADNFTTNAEEIIGRLSGIVGTALEVQRMMRRMGGVDAA